MPSRILLDTSSYLRLAFTIHPLLRQPFGKNHEELFILAELFSEFRRNPRLRNDFSWVLESKYIENRKAGRLIIRDPQKGDINRTLGIMTRVAELSGIAVSPTDIKCLACGYELDIQVVTDDTEMLSLSQEFNINCLTSLGLLKRMLDESFKSQKQIDDIVKYWEYANDFPANWRKQYREFFKKDPPSGL
jgi:predicted DNA-binding protein (UPF0278 family)